MLGNKHVFWEALIIALVIFWAGILLGVYFEKTRVDKLQNFYFDSETEIFDFQLFSEIISSKDLNCNKVSEKSILFADKIYSQALKLEKYDTSNKITEDLFSLHRRYDLLRVMLWKELIENKKRCKTNVNTVVYLYDYADTPVNEKAIQGAMSNFLIDLKGEYKDTIILIPIAVDTEVNSLDFLREIYGLEKIPMIFVNEKAKIDNLESLKDVKKYLS
ncbi:MAG: hypothetical protein KKA64_00060 [Nanoarchaeota archaeon]|nr:hypothetical protein [Nanoarchaeota archaeon]